MKAPPTLAKIASLVAITSGFTTLLSAQDVRRVDPAPSNQRATVVDRNTGTSLSTPAPDLTRGVFLASIDAEDRSLRRYAGQNLFNTEGAELGEIKDFIVHPQSSRVQYLVVSAGGVGGMGNRLRLVPVEALRWGSRANAFEVDILQSAWLQVPPISDQHYVIDRFDISPAQHQAMAQRYGSGARATNSATTSGATQAATGMVRASILRGKAVHAGNVKVGDIENIIIDLERGTAGALIDSSGAFTGTTAKYIVPLGSLTFSDARQDPIGTTLTRADFDRAVPGNFAPSHSATTGR
jgi:sporulation protein YlmC with PRC-barrel domain